jgi:hypothetical protein
MIKDNFRIKLKSIENGEELTIFGSLLGEDNGLLHYSIELDRWKIISCVQTTGCFDVNGKEIFFGDSVTYDKEEIFEVTVDEHTQVTIIFNEKFGHIELHKCCKAIELLEDEYL